MACTLVIRLSALGDVAMTIPVVYSVADRYPADEFILLTKKPLLSLFVNKPSNLKIFPVLTKDKHKGMTGIWKLFRELDKRNIDQIADLHQVLRSIEIDCYFKLKGKKVAVIDKDRKNKRALIRKDKKKIMPLKSSFERYQKVFEELGYNASLDFVSLFAAKEKKEETRIGIAPFAKHQSKIYPFEKMEEVVRLLNEKPSTKIYLFGGKGECDRLENWAAKYEQAESIAGHLSFPEELLLMNSLDIMLSMDSANMHLASLVNIPVVSIWGATHPYAGFYGYNQSIENAIQLDMDCRPCSVFGSNFCRRGDFACMKNIAPEKIVEKIMLNLKSR
jgi:ADP-heptose:LPS heptosyltransferase